MDARPRRVAVVLFNLGGPDSPAAIKPFLLNLFQGFCYIGGGQLTAWLGDRGSLIVFSLLTITGYVIFLAIPHPWATVLACLLILGWESLSMPVTFTASAAPNRSTL